MFTSGVDHRFSLPEAADRKLTARKIRNVIFLSTPLSGRNDDQRTMSDEFLKVDCAKVEFEDI